MSKGFEKAYESMGLAEGPANGHRPSETPNPLLVGRVPLDGILRDGAPPPDEHEKGLLIRGAVHHVYGPSAQGKSWVTLWLVARALRRGETVCYFDSENGKRITAERLGELGVTPEEAANLHYWPDGGDLTLDPTSKHHYREVLEVLKPDLILFDALIYFLTNAGLGENDPDGIVAWSLAFTRTARDMGITTILVDHTGHDESRARGSSRKRQEMDVQWSVKATQPFDRNTVGEITLRREKDRESWLPEVLKFSAGGTEDGFLMQPSAGTIEDAAHGEGLTPSAYKALRVLRERPGLTYNEWKNLAAENGVPNGSFGRVVRERLKPHPARVYPKENLYYPTEGPGSSDTDLDTAENPPQPPTPQPGDTDLDTDESRIDNRNDTERYHRDTEPGITDTCVERGARYHGITPLIGGVPDTEPHHRYRTPEPPDGGNDDERDRVALEALRKGNGPRETLEGCETNDTFEQVIRSVMSYAGCPGDEPDDWEASVIRAVGIVSRKGVEA